MNNKLWKEFTGWGSGFTLEGDRDYKSKREPLFYHLKVYGIHFPDGYELVGDNIDKLLEEAIQEGKHNRYRFLDTSS